jgi:multidrug efflux pump subunit AcrB
MNLIQNALRKPITVIVTVLAILFFSALALRNSRLDIFPTLGVPTIYVAQTYGGLSPQQIEGFITSYYEYHFLYINGIKSVDSKSIQGVALIKLEFHEGTDMAAALAETISYANRSRSFMPPGTLPPFIMRYDAGSAPVGQLVFSSETRSLSEIQDLALFKVRPLFAALAGVSAPPPFGGNQRSVLVKADPERMRSYGLTPDELVMAIARNNTISPAGNVRIGDISFIAPSNSVVDNIKELEQIPLTLGSGASIYVRDVASVDNGADVTTGYALINGKRSVYIPVAKRADASTWNVVKEIKKNLPAMQAAIPEDIKVSYEFDQSGYVINSLRSLMFEGGLGAILTGLMVLLFLGDRRSALIVVLTIPLALLSSVVFLYLFDQTINIMTLGGLALAVGILVDEATVTVENIHRHMELGKSKSKAILDASREIAGPKLLILISILAVFVPSFFMSGVTKSMFVPLSLAVGFAMVASFLLSQTFVPVVSNWFLKDSIDHDNKKFENFRSRFLDTFDKISPLGSIIFPALIIITLLGAFLLFRITGTEIFPNADAGQFQVRLRMPTGTRIERTEKATKDVLHILDTLSGNKIDITSSFVGLQPPTYAINPIFLWTSGPHESVIKVKLNDDSNISLSEFKEDVRAAIKKYNPSIALSFEPADLIEQVMSMGTSTPVEIAVQARNLNEGRKYAEKLQAELSKLPYLRDVQFGLPLDYPTLQLSYDRVRSGQLGLTVEQAAKSVVAGTYSSRLTQPIYWLDKTTGNAYQVQVEYPQFRMNSPEQIEDIPLGDHDNQSIYLRDVADWKKTNTIGEYDRLNQQRYITVTANLHEHDPGSAFNEIRKTIESLGELPHGMKINLRGQAELLNQTLGELSIGLLIAVVVIFLLMAANFQSFSLSFSIISIIPCVIFGSFLLLVITGNTLNIQSFLGSIMAIGVSVSNAILFITSAESIRRTGPDRSNIGREAVSHRLRPIIMTAAAMTAGMVPMAIGIGEGGDQTAPLGVAVIGGLLFSTVAILLVLPLGYNLIAGSKKFESASLDPEDQNSKHFGNQ